MYNRWLLLAGTLSAIAALLHLGCIVGGPAWYRALGAGSRMVRLAERGSIEPAAITLGITCVLAIWSLYAFSGAGLIPRLPLLRTALCAITAIYLLRAMALPWMLAHAVGPGRSATFLVVSSAIVLVYGLVHAIGLWTAWSRLAPSP